MQDRYSLRFESGEREGEIVPVPTGRFSVGRRPGNSLQITDGSVSGQHAVLIVDELGGLRLRDLESKNGTLVGGARIEDASAAHGDTISFGNVRLTLIDREFSDVEPAAAAPVSGQETIGAVRADKLARAGQRSRAGLLFGIAALLAVGGLAWMLIGRGGGGGGGGLRPVRAPAGNLLNDNYSFEDAASDAWRSDGDASGSFHALGAAKVSGALGMRAELDPDTFARLVSQPVGARQGQTLRLSAELRARGGAAGRAGVEFLRSEPGTEGPGSLHAFGPWVSGDEGFQGVELAFAVPPATVRARAVIEARAGQDLGGSVDTDDVALVAESGGAAPLSEGGDHQLMLLGEPPQSAALYKLGRPLIGELQVAPATTGAGPPLTVALSLEPEERRTRVRFEGIQGDALLSLRLEPAAVVSGLATMGSGGHFPHGSDFEREDATGLLVGSGVDVIALRFDAPVAIRGAADGGGVRVRVDLGRQQSFVAQLDFSAERKLAGDLAHAARMAERDGRLGECMAKWRELLERYPFEKALVTEAEAARGRHSNAANVALMEARENYERGQYFGLVEHFRGTLAEVAALSQRYAGSEVELSARELATAIQGSIDQLLEGTQRTEVAGLESILMLLQEVEAPGLAGEVHGELARRSGHQQRTGTQDPIGSDQ